MELVDFLRSLVTRKDDEEEKRKEIATKASPVVFNHDEFKPSAVDKVKKFVSEGTERVRQSFRFEDPGQYNFFKQVAEGNIETGIKPVDNFNRTGMQFIENRVIKPVQQIPENIETIRSKDASLLQKGGAALSTVAALVPGVDDAAFATLYDVPKAGIANKSKLKAFTGEEYTGLGDSLAKNNDTAANVLNTAELPLILAGSVAGRKQAGKLLASQADSPAVANAVKQGKLSIDSEEVKQTYKAFESLKPAFDNTLTSIGKKLGIRVDTPELKDAARTVEKASADYGGDVTKVKDIARAQFVPDSPEQAKQLLQELEGNFSINRVRDRFANPGPDGYRDFQINVDLGDGKLAEIQVQLPEMLEAKNGAGWETYKKFRSLDAASKERQLTPAELGQLKQFEQEMKVVYDEAWGKANARLGSSDAPSSFNMALNSSSDISDPLRKTDSTGNLLGGVESNANMSAAPVSSSTIETGTPSTSKNLVDTNNIVADSTVRELPPIDRTKLTGLQLSKSNEELQALRQNTPPIGTVENLDSSPVNRTPMQELISEKRNAQVGDVAQPRVKIEEDGKLRSQVEPKFEAALKYYDTPDQIKSAIAESVDQNLENVQKQRRGEITFKETRNLADALGMSVEDVEKRKIGKVWNAEQADAATRMTIDVNEKLNEVSTQVRKLQDAGEAVPENLMLKQMDLATQSQAMIASILGDNAEAGRALNARKMLKSAMETGDLKAKKQAMQMFAGDEKKAAEVLKKLSQFDPDDNLGRTKFLQKVKPSTTMDKIEEYWYNSVLSNTATHIVNTTSNAVTSLLSIPEKAIAGTIDAGMEKGAALLGKAFKRDRYAAEAASEAAGFSQGVKNGLRRFAYVMRNGVSEEAATKLELGRGQAIKGPIGDFVNIPSKALVAGDELFKAINYEMDLYAQATRQAAKEGLSGVERVTRQAELIANPTPQMVESANATAAYKVFQADSNMGSAIRYARDKISIPIPKVGDFKPLRFIIPFIQTPVNVAKFGLERSPAGFIGTGYKSLTGVSKGEVLDSASRAIMGSMAMVPLAMYFTEGKITGSPPKDKKERDAFYADGKLPYSVKIGDNWIAYNRSEPLNTILTQIATWHAASDGGEATTVEQISDFVRTAGRNFADQTFMTGVGNIVNAIDDPERFGQKFITDIVGGFVPSLVAAGARSIDSTVRQPETITGALKTRLPILSRDEPAMQSDYELGGEVQRHTNDGVVRNILSNFGGLRTTKETGTNYQEDVQTVRKADRETRDRRVEVEKAAQDLISNIRNAPPEDKQKVVQDAVSSGALDQDTLTQLNSDLKKLATGAGLDKEMETIKGYSNETKARYMIQKMQGMDEQQRLEWIKPMMDNKIITTDTFKELQKVLESDQKLPLIDR